MMLALGALIRLYATALVLGLWALVWWGGARGDAVIGVFLVALTGAAIISEVERQRLRRRVREHD